ARTERIDDRSVEAANAYRVAGPPPESPVLVLRPLDASIGNDRLGSVRVGRDRQMGAWSSQRLHPRVEQLLRVLAPDGSWPPLRARWNMAVRCWRVAAEHLLHGNGRFARALDEPSSGRGSTVRLTHVRISM